jgi:xylulokinase
MAPLFLGLDLSTQQLKAVLISEDAQVVNEFAVAFDKDLPQYETTSGAILGPAEGEVNPLMYHLPQFNANVGDISRRHVAGRDGSPHGKDAAGRHTIWRDYRYIWGWPSEHPNLISFAACLSHIQQHGSVYWSTHAEGALASLDAAHTLREQLSPKAFSVQRAPIWQDSSSTQDCRALEDAIGGPQALADLSGSRAYERFTGPQIAKAGLLNFAIIHRLTHIQIRRLYPGAYDATSRISLVSSFVPSLFLGRIAPIEVSDASGMNLMNVLTCKWDDRLLEACGGPALREKLGPEPVPGGSSLGTISKWWTSRWGFKAGAYSTLSSTLSAAERLLRLHHCTVHRRQSCDCRITFGTWGCSSFSGNIYHPSAVYPSGGHTSQALHDIASTCPPDDIGCSNCHAVLQKWRARP